jgi:hypothetical protein
MVGAVDLCERVLFYPFDQMFLKLQKTFHRYARQFDMCPGGFQQAESTGNPLQRFYEISGSLTIDGIDIR